MGDDGVEFVHRLQERRTNIVNLELAASSEVCEEARQHFAEGM